MAEQIDSRARNQVEIGDSMFSAKAPHDSLNQELAEAFYPERADFTSMREPGSEWADHLHDSHPVFARREFCDSIASMMRPRGKEWGAIRMRREELMEIPAVKQWCEQKTKVLMRMLYDPAAMFPRATKMADHDYGTFGNAVITCEEAIEGQHLYYQNHHLRDVAWAEGLWGKIDVIHRKAKKPLRWVAQRFPKTFPETLRNSLATEPNLMVEVRHIVCPRTDFERTQEQKAERAGRKGKEPPFVELYMLRETSTTLAERDLKHNPYVIPRWHLTTASPYAYSPAAITALPDSRQAQALALMFREAGEKALDPPMVAQKQALLSELSLVPGSITYVDQEYDERMGPAVRELMQNKGLPAGLEMQQDLREMIGQAWMLNKLALPAPERDMTAYETARRMEEYVRSAVPLFEPLEHDYNAPLLDLATNLAISLGAFGKPEEWPEEILGQDLDFAFENAIQAAQRENATNAFIRGIEIIGGARSLDQGAFAGLSLTKGGREALEGVGWQSDWLPDEDEQEAASEMAGEQAQAAQMLQLVQGGAGAAKDAGAAAKALTEAEMMGAAA